MGSLILSSLLEDLGGVTRREGCGIKGFYLHFGGLVFGKPWLYRSGFPFPQP